MTSEQSPISLEEENASGKNVTKTQQDINLFWNEFNSKQDAIEKGIQDADKTIEIGSEEMSKHLESLYIQLEGLKKHFSQSTMILPSYEIRQAQKMIALVEDQLAQGKVKLLPKKKFTFKNKKTVSSDHMQQSAKKESNTISNVDDTTLKAMQIQSDDEYIISNTENQDIYLHNQKLRALHIFNLQNCRVFTGAVQGSIMLDNCKHCTFVLASQQIRIHSTEDSKFYLYVRSNPIIENCNRVQFSPYNFNYDNRSSQFEEANFDLEKNNWSKVEDFNWIKAQKSPHWSIVPVELRVPEFLPPNT